MSEPASIEKLLLRQLKRVGLSYENPPSSLDEWQNILELVNRVYTQCNQDRYLMERSLSIASKEMSDLKERIENAQRLAGIGYWFYDTVSGKITWSKEIYDLFGINYEESVPSYDVIMKDYIHPDDCSRLHNMIQKSLATGNEYEAEIRVINKKTNECKWFYVKGGPQKSKNVKSLYEVLSGITFDITKRKESELEISELNQQLVTSARQSGMAEMSISVLHNIGNVLNSVNVSANMIVENFNIARITQLQKAVEMLKNNLPTLQEYLLNDPRGRLLPQFFDATIKTLSDEYYLINEEIQNISVYTEHMKEIIKKQQEFSTVSGISVAFTIKGLLADAVVLSLGSINRYLVNIKINMDENQEIIGEKHKILQILINLLRNAADSICMSRKQNNRIDIVTYLHEKNILEIQVKDGGAGIDKKNMKKIFGFGFTTKDKGHGFGLHNSALIAKELGGDLSVESEGVGKGAIFKLKIPIKTRNGGDV